MAKRLKLCLDELEGETWGPPDYDSHLVQRAHELRTTPIGEFTAEDLELMISQGIGLFFLVPLAIEMLEADVAVEAVFFPGDLLEAVLGVPADYWQSQQDQCDRLRLVTANTRGVSPETVAVIHRWRHGTA